MTTETARIIATRVMGWKLSSGGTYWETGNPLRLIPIEEYDPEHNLAQAVAALEKFSKHFDISMRRNYLCMVNGEFVGDGPTLPAAITAALIAAVGET